MKVGDIFTNSEYAIRRESDCFAYRIISIDKDVVEAVSLKLDNISRPTRLKLANISFAGQKKISWPIQEGNIELFTATKFGAKKCIINSAKCLIESDINALWYTCFDEAHCDVLAELMRVSERKPSLESKLIRIQNELEDVSYKLATLDAEVNGAKVNASYCVLF